MDKNEPESPKLPTKGVATKEESPPDASSVHLTVRDAVAIATVSIALLCLGVFICGELGGHPPAAKYLAVGGTFFAGVFYGLITIATRYRTFALRAVLSKTGSLYWVSYGIISVATLALLLRYPDLFIGYAKSDLFLQMLAAATGGVVIIKSNLIGLGSVLEDFLSLLDESIQAEQGQIHADSILDLVPQIETEEELKQAFDFLRLVFGSIPNLNPDKKSQLFTSLEENRQVEGLVPFFRLANVFLKFCDIVRGARIEELSASLRRYLSNNKSPTR